MTTAKPITERANGSLMLACVLMLWLVPSAASATSQVFRVTGSLFDNSGNALNGGSHTLIVNAYSAATGGVALWTSSTYSSIAANYGQFTVDVDASIGSPSLSAQVMNLPASAALWFELTVDSNIVRPRIRAKGTAFALNSQTTDGIRGYPISTATPTTGSVMAFSGTSWAPSTISASSVNALSRTGDSMSGVLNIGANLTATNILTVNSLTIPGLTPNRAVFSNATKYLTSTTVAVTDVEVGSIANVTGNIQTQLNSLLTGVTSYGFAAVSPLSLSGGAGLVGASATISVATASASSSGILLASDWNAFHSAESLWPSKVVKSGDTMTGPLVTPGVVAAPVYLSSLGAGELVRSNGSNTLTSSSVSVSDAQLAYLSGVQGGIEAQLSQKLTGTTITQPVGMIYPFAGGRHGSTTSGSMSIGGLVGTSTLSVGQQIVASTAILPSGTTITAITGGNSVTVSAAALSTVSGALLVVPPSGYLVCDGSAISRTTYANLFAAVGSSWGPGDGSATFNLPDLRGRFLRGQNMGAGVDPDVATRAAAVAGANAGDAVGSYEASAYASHFHLLNDPGHTHTLTDPGHSHGVSDPGHAHTYVAPSYVGTFAGGADMGVSYTGAYMSAAVTGLSTYAAATGITISGVTTGITLGNAGGNETRPVNSDVNYIIKY